MLSDGSKRGKTVPLSGWRPTINHKIRKYPNRKHRPAKLIARGRYPERWELKRSNI
jgi:hypothetical protein